MGIFETLAALFHDISVLVALAFWPVHGAFMAVIGLFQSILENTIGLF